jgi:hypothetical protein
MDKKILIYEDSGQKQTFRLACETTAAQANDLIGYFEEFQDLRRITTLAEFERLVSDPLEYFDETLRDNVEMRMTGGREPEPSTLAKLFGYERDNFNAVISGLPVTVDCQPCKTSRVVRRAGKPAITSTRWSAYKNYLTFTPEGFILNEAEIEKHCERFKTFAENEQQIAVVDHYNTLVTILNSHDAMFPLAPTDKELLTRIFGLHIEHPPYQGRFLINSEHLRNSIYK